MKDSLIRFCLLTFIILATTSCATQDKKVAEKSATPEPVVKESINMDMPVKKIKIPKEKDKKVKVDSAENGKRVDEVKKMMKKKIFTQKLYEKKSRGVNPNAFYRFKTESAKKQALINDGVHDPAADLTELQPPIEAFKALPSATFGNGVNWVKALDKHKISPRADQMGKKKQFALEMNITMPVKGTMNDVLFPHKIHTEWLACKNCHTGIFQMKKGGNNITMAKIVKGQYCGVCHGKVSFPIANCNRCHSEKKMAKIRK